ncbi:MAG: ATP-binding protein [Candidatus Poribacteria bacterium]|nr:ATP-binding protein [Candidatus Poribacteria bacterium]
MFINRHQELAALDRMFQSETAELFVLYGRRRVGKTELLLQFCKDKRSIYFLASQLKERDHLRQLTETARHVINDPLLQSIIFDDWESALIYFAQQAEEERLVLVLDEFQYLCEDNAALPSLIQRFWDLHGKNSKLFLILCGSQISFMEREVLAERSPLYGRRTGQLQLMPLSYRDSGDFFSAYSAKEKLTAYGILDGVPAYLNRFALHPLNSSQDIPQEVFEQHIKNELLTPQGYLFDEVNFLLRMELREPKTYASVLHAIAGGATRLNEIAQQVKLSSTDTNKYLSVLQELALVKRETPVTERAPQKSRKGLYKISDNYVKFWFRFVLPNRSLIEFGNADLVYQQIIAPNLSHYMGAIFEDICRQYISLYWGETLKVAPRRVGAHWGSNLEIDVLTENVDGSHWFGECKWWEAPVGENVLNSLIENAAKVPEQWKRNPRYILFSVNGFTNALRQRAEKAGVFLIEANDLF